jgi:glyoxylase-like metal-dependent hydrolase (beta-lactamase superfamily II)
MAKVEHFYEKESGTLTYILWDAATKQAAIIDSLLDFDIKPARWTTTSADAVLAKVKELGVNVQYILETHVHADHLTASQYLKQKLTKEDGSGAPPICIGTHITAVLKHWVPIFNIAHDTPLDGKQFDRLFRDDEEFLIGSLKVKVIYTPGHTPACVTYFLPDHKMAFCGDTIFNPEMGNARADFPGGSPKTLFESARRLLALGDDVVLYVGHDYPEQGPPVPGVAVKEHKEKNCTLNLRVTEAEFVAANSDSLPVPRLLLPSLQVNLRAGGFGAKESNGIQFIKLPLNQF